MPTAAPARFMPSLDSIIAAHAELRAVRPLVQCLTNVVSANFMANVLLAAGASPAMVDNPEEAAGFARVAGAVLVNLGTPSSAQVEGMRQAVRSAVVHGTPWVLDPIGAGGLPWRGGVAAELLQQRPAVVRGNASEIIGLAGLGQGAPGFDSSDDPARAVPAAVELLRNCQAVSASGAVDHLLGWVGDSRESAVPRLLRIGGGSALLPRVTASGCALGALVAAYTAVAVDAFTALAAAHVHFAVAAEIAEAASRGPGSFAVAFIDALDAVDANLLRQRARLMSVQSTA
ncbi:hydroxyethylthiazole kinase [Pseudomonas citronellolis]|uniref:hydroxyethylthiazole kinase n=1 Tax=Pseudomonas citronellolis TaxID=53408 RepID=UPI0021131E29|nr:hydroxyethylthiazole kinase [Pseudomonas citronellolis]UUC53110.1 hydroxyethylthiazole kinase [Pseudomonas citronellolis]